jgi:hypothetical protein
MQKLVSKRTGKGGELKQAKRKRMVEEHSERATSGYCTARQPSAKISSSRLTIRYSL